MNKINGSYACEKQYISAKYLKAELGFPGIVHPYASAQHDGMESNNAGQDFGLVSLEQLHSPPHSQRVASLKLDWMIWSSVT